MAISLRQREFTAECMTVWTITRKLHTCVGIIVSRMFLIVSMVSGGEVVLEFSLLLWLGVLDWLRVGCWSGSLPNVMRAFSETWGTAVKKKNTVIRLQRHCLDMFSSSSTYVSFNHGRCFRFWKFSMRAFAGPELVWIWSAEARERKTENTQYSLQVSKLHLPLHIDLINS